MSNRRASQERLDETLSDVAHPTLESNVNDRNRNRVEGGFLAEYTESRLRPTHPRNADNDEDHPPPLDLSQLPKEQREALIEEVADSLRKILIPVSLCLAGVVIVISSINFYTRNDGIYLPYIAFNEDGPISGASKFGHAIVNSLIIVGIVAVMTMFLVFLYYCRCYKFIDCWMMVVSFMVLFMFSATFLLQVIEAANWSFDYISYAVLLYNFGIMGLVAIHWKSPLRVQQFYLIAMSALMSLVFIKYLPEWTSWVFLVALALYDIIAVLCPGGPLKILLNIVQERNQPLMPALIYSSMAWVMSAASSPYTGEGKTNIKSGGLEESIDDDPIEVDSPSPSQFGANNDNTDQNPENAQVDQTNVINAFDDYEVAGVKLGLGDFIFYSVLIGKAAASNDWNTVYACTMGILTGLCSTLILLAVSKHALPALPISVALGVLFFFTTYYSVTPMIDDLSKNMMFL